MSWRHVAAGIGFLQLATWSTAAASPPLRSHQSRASDAGEGPGRRAGRGCGADWNSLVQTWARGRLDGTIEGGIEGGAEGGSGGGAEQEAPQKYPRVEDVDSEDPDIVSLHYNVTEWLALAPRKPKNITLRGGGGLNVCMNDRFVPEFFIIGVVKAGTTSLSSDLRMSSSFLWPRQPLSEVTRKEGHFLDEHYFKGPFWMSQNYPKCRRDVRMVASDSSPRYLIDPNVDERISRWYGHMKHDLKFYVVLREPMARFHSDYYHARSSDWCDAMKTLAFRDVVDRVLTGRWQQFVGGGGSCQDRLEGSLYKRHLERWFARFSPSQFTVVPWLFYVAPGERGRPRRTIAQHVWDSLGVQPGIVMEPVKSNGHPHAKLDQDLNRTAIEAFQKFLDPWSSPAVLADLFVSSPGVKLYGHQGHHAFKRTRKGVAAWIVDNW